MALFTSQFFGPLAGGSLAAAIGIRPTFFATSGFYLLAFLLVFTQVDERFERPPIGERMSFAGNLRVVLQVRPLVALIALIFFMNAGPAYIRPLIPIIVGGFDVAASAETLSGVAFATMALTSAVAALAASRLATRFGARIALALVTVAAGAAYLPVGVAGSLPVLFLLIAAIGLFSGAMIPMANTLIDAWAPPGRQASAFGLTGSALALAFAIAPLTGGAVASAAGIETSVIVIGAITIAVGLAIPALVREAGAGEPEPAAAVAEGGE